MTRKYIVLRGMTDDPSEFIGIANTIKDAYIMGEKAYSGDPFGWVEVYECEEVGLYDPVLHGHWIFEGEGWRTMEEP